MQHIVYYIENSDNAFYPCICINQVICQEHMFNCDINLFKLEPNFINLHNIVRHTQLLFLSNNSLITSYNIIWNYTNCFLKQFIVYSPQFFWCPPKIFEVFSDPYIQIYEF